MGNIQPTRQIQSIIWLVASIYENMRLHPKMMPSSRQLSIPQGLVQRQLQVFLLTPEQHNRPWHVIGSVRFLSVMFVSRFEFAAVSSSDHSGSKTSVSEEVK